MFVLDSVKPDTLSHLTGPIFHVDLGHVGHVTQALHAVSLPGPHWF